MGSKLFIKIFGERNTGTTYLENLVQKNLSCSLLPGTAPRPIKGQSKRLDFLRDIYFALTSHANLGWKHSYPCEEVIIKFREKKANLFIITLTKNPYSWLLSLYKRPYHYQGELTSFSAFIRTPWKVMKRDNSPRDFANPIEMWNTKNRRYLELPKFTECYNCTYEGLLASPESIIDILCARSNARNIGNFSNIHVSTKEKLRKNFDDYKDYYLNEKWREKLLKEDIQYINENLDHAVMSTFSYEMLGSTNKLRQ